VQSGLDRVVRGLDEIAAIWISPTGAGSVFGTSAFSPADTRDLSKLPGVRSVQLYRSGLLDIAGSRAWVIGAPAQTSRPIPPDDVLEGKLSQASQRVRDGGWATLSSALADDLGVQVGQQVVLPTPNPLTVRVAAVTTNFGWSGGSVVMNARDFARAWGSIAIAAYHVQLSSGTTPELGSRRVSQALGQRSGLHVETAAQRVDKQTAAARSGLARLRLIAQLTLLAAILATGAAMTGLLWQHRSIVADFKLNGLTTGLLWPSLLVETGVLFCTGAFAGGVFGLLGQQLCTRGVQVVTGFPVVDGLRIGIAAMTVGVVIGASLLTVLIPGYLVARVDPDWDE
jgi:putative ABC transport system permease protein